MRSLRSIEFLPYKGFSMQVGISEAIRLLSTLLIKVLTFEPYGLKENSLHMYSTSTKDRKKAEKRFNEWLAGLIDGEGNFYLSKLGGSTGLEITMDLRDEHCLYIIKQKYGGSVKLRSGVKAVRYRLFHKAGLLALIEDVNGLIRNPIRIEQLKKICEKYEIIVKQPKPLEYENGWLAGFFDSDGSISINKINNVIIIAFSQKDRILLEPLVELYGGKIYIHNKNQTAFKWTI